MHRFLNDWGLSKLGEDIWHNKYQHGNESFEQWLKRVSGDDEAVAKLIYDKKFLFGGRILANRGLNSEGRKVTYSNCYVLPAPADSIESIYKTCSDLARTYSYGGGVGIDISNLRPKGMKVHNAAETTSGAVSFMDTFSNVSEVIGQGGRRGALMISMKCTHPDIEDFIDIKNDLNKVTKANISVMVTDDFMEAVQNDGDWELSFTTEYGDTLKKTIKAKDLFMKLCKNNWRMGEPGILYWDKIKNYNLLNEDEDFNYAGVNPCAEEPLPAGGSCLLGSINLSAYVEDKKFKAKELIEDMKVIVKGMNDVLDEGLSLHPLEIQQETVFEYRQIGIGIMGLADMLIKMELEYGSSESIELCDSIGYIIAKNAIYNSCNLANKYGAYPKYTDKILLSKFFEEHNNGIDAYYGLRNSQLLTIAPTGSISTMLGISGGIEPIFANSYTRKTESLKGHDEYYKVYTPIVECYMYENKLKDESELPSYFVTSNDISPNRRIEMQSVWQKHIDASISSTINLPNSATVEDIYNIYITAWKKGLKGITVYRDGCDRTGILTTDTTNKEEVKNYVDTGIENCIAVGTKLNTGCGSLWVTVYFHRETNQLCHIFLNKGSKGGCLSYMIGLSRLISLAGKRGATLDEIIDQLNSVPACPSYVANKVTSKGKCCPNAIGNALYDLYKQFKHIRCREISPCDDKITDVEKDIILEQFSKIALQRLNVCPNCGEELTFTGGCNTCPNCGWSKCE